MVLWMKQIFKTKLEVLEVMYEVQERRARIGYFSLMDFLGNGWVVRVIVTNKG